MFIQLYFGKKDNTGKPIQLADVLKMIVASTALQTRTVELRHRLAINNDNKASLETTQKGNEGFAAYVKEGEQRYEEIKGNLPAVTWSGTFTKRSIKSIKEYSHLICLDIDKVTDPVEHASLFSTICMDRFTFICFTSPSGTGLKVIFKLGEHESAKHKDAFLSIEKYFKEKYNVDIDKSGKDVSRLCFLCHDPQLFVNEKCTIYELPEKNHSESGADKPTGSVPGKTLRHNTAAEKAFTRKEETEFEATITPEDVYRFTEKRIAYTEGNRNRFLWLFCNNCNRRGIPMDQCDNYCRQNMPDRDNEEIRQSIENAYNNNAHEHGKYAKKTKVQSVHTNTAGSNLGNESNPKPPEGAPLPNHISGNRNEKPGVEDKKQAGRNGLPASHADYIRFWKERKITKGRGDDKYTVTDYALMRVEFVDFLFQQGFHLIDTDAHGGYQLCQSNHGIIEPVDPRKIKKFVFSFCKKNLVKDIEEMMRERQRTVFAMEEMNSLHTKAIDFKTDTEKESFFYFKNRWATVSEAGITTHQYNDLHQYIWAGNKKEHHFTAQPPKLFDSEGRLSKDAMDCEFAKFVFLASYNPNNVDEKDFSADIIDQRFNSFCSAIGFMLDGYKHPSDRKAVFALDHTIGERGEKHGRTGKSIIPKACAFLKVVSHINGKTFDPRYAFRYEVITADSQIIDFNDMRSNFDPEEIFEIIADDYSILRRNNGYLHFKYENSPKVWYSTNATPKGDGTSYAGRMFTLEFSDYFTPEHTPFVEFGHGMLGSAWDVEEWNRFYNFMLWCVQLYKTDGFVQYPKSNLNERKLKNEVDIEFIDFMDNEVERNKRHEKMKLLESARKIISAANGGGKPLSSHTFHKWIKRYCTGNGLFLNPHIPPGKYDKIGGTEYYTIATTPDFKPGENEPKLF